MSSYHHHHQQQHLHHDRPPKLLTIYILLLLLLLSTIPITHSLNNNNNNNEHSKTLFQSLKTQIQQTLFPSTSSTTTTSFTPNETTNYLSNLETISQLRVRDIKRRLTRQHGYSSNELSKMIYKKDLVDLLVYEENKVRELKRMDEVRMWSMRGLVLTAVVGLVTLFWEVLMRGWEVWCVNFVVYTDKKKYEISRSFELKSKQAFLLILLMSFIDILNLWLSISVLLSWIIPRSKYFLPIPNLSIQPAALLAAGTNNNNNSMPLGRYGINVGPMVITFILRWIHGTVEGWTGRVMSTAMSRMRQEAKLKRRKEREGETEEERVERRKRKMERRKEKEEVRRRRVEMAEAMARKEREEEDKEEEGCGVVAGGVCNGFNGNGAVDAACASGKVPGDLGGSYVFSPNPTNQYNGSDPSDEKEEDWIKIASESVAKDDTTTSSPVEEEVGTAFDDLD